MLLPPDPLNLLEVPVWRWSWILGFSLALCLQTDAGGSGCLGSLSGALLGSPDRGLLWVPRGQNRCCPPLTGQGSELSWLTELAGTCLDSLMQADLRVSHFNCYSGLGKKKKRKCLKKRNASAYFRKKICSIICIEENARKTVQLSLFSLLFERASSTLQLLSSLPANSAEVTQWEMPGKLLLTWAITLKCLDRTSYCLEHICIHSQCKSPWKALCRSPPFWAFPVAPVFQSKPIGDEFWACLGMWIPSYIPGFMSLTVNILLSFHHCFCRDQLQLHVLLPLALQPWPQGHGTDLRQELCIWSQGMPGTPKSDQLPTDSNRNARAVRSWQPPSPALWDLSTL